MLRAARPPWEDEVIRRPCRRPSKPSSCRAACQCPELARVVEHQPGSLLLVLLPRPPLPRLRSLPPPVPLASHEVLHRRSFSHPRCPRRHHRRSARDHLARRSQPVVGRVVLFPFFLVAGKLIWPRSLLRRPVAQSDNVVSWTCKTSPFTNFTVLCVSPLFFHACTHLRPL